MDLGRLHAPRVVLIAPHPDDEVLGAGGTLAALAARGAQVHVVAVTDGEASHPGRSRELRRLRVAERAVALRRLGLDGAVVHRLRLPDGGVADDELAGRLRPLVGPDDVVLAPWSQDGHPDHDACGRAAAALPGRRWSYLVWGWHWAAPADIPWDRAWRVPLGPRRHQDKTAAVDAFTSQLTGQEPILPPHVLARVLRSDEVFLEDMS